MTTNSAPGASLRSLRLRRLLAGVSVLAFTAVAFTGSPAWGEPREKEPREKIVFTSACVCPEFVTKSEIYIMNPDGSKPARLTNDGFGDGLPTGLSPDGQGNIVFDSNRIATEPGVGGTPLDSDLFLINHASADDDAPMPLTRGSSATFDPTGRYIAFHRSASPMPAPYGKRIAAGLGPATGVRGEPGGPTTDSDIFRLNLDDLSLVNLTNGLCDPTPTGSCRPSPSGVRGGPFASDDADWSPDGKWIAFTSRQVDIDGKPVPSTAGIYVMNLETNNVTRLTISDMDERSPAWSPDGTRIAIMKKRADAVASPFNIWVLTLNPERTLVTSAIQLTDDTSGTVTPAWSPTGEKIAFQSNRGPSQIFVVDADGVRCAPDSALCPWTQLTGPPPAPAGALLGRSLFPKWSPKWGRIAVGGDPAPGTQ
jgi:WD40-like Beta Propeller Repeat